jgi:Flp pilus assembly pilin Flp
MRYGLIKKLLREEGGAFAAEYAVLIGCLAMLLVVAMNQLSSALSHVFNYMADYLAGLG